MKQVKIFDLDNNEYHGGIQFENGNVICGCCGGLLPKDEETETWLLIETYENWNNLDNAIIG